MLVGLPGAGKSIVGRAVAERLHRDFLDFDVEIERREGRSVARIFAELGERRFRELETVLTREVAALDGMILSPGGGWATDAERIALLRPPARLIWLRVSPEEAVRRLGDRVADRPLLAGLDPVAAMRRLLGERAPSYVLADFVVDTEAIDLQQLITHVARLATP